MAKFAFVLLIALMLVIEAQLKHLPPRTFPDREPIEPEYVNSDFHVRHKSLTVKAILEKLEKDSAIAGRPRFGRSTKLALHRTDQLD